MRNIDDANAFGLEALDDGEQLVDLGVVQRGGRLIHDEDARFVGQRLGNLDHLLARDGERADHNLGVELEIHGAEDGFRLRIEGAFVEQQPTQLARFAANEDVLRGGQVAHQREFLMNDGNALIERLARAAHFDGLTIEPDLASIALINAGQHFHQRGFASAILAHQGMNFASAQLEARIVQRAHAGECLVDAHHFDERSRRASGCCLRYRGGVRHC